MLSLGTSEVYFVGRTSLLSNVNWDRKKVRNSGYKWMLEKIESMLML